jgi:hypothetical protein
MIALQTEERTLGGSTSLSGDIAKHLADRLPFGAVVVVSKQPDTLLPSVRKEWLHIMRQVQRERASTLKAANILEITKKIASMQRARFSAKSPREDVLANVHFATAEQLLEFAPGCQTMYVATPTDNETLHKITSFMVEGGLVVVYKTWDIKSSYLT